MKKLPDTLAVIVLLTGLALACARLLAGCTPAAGRAANVAGYTAALTECRAEGKDAGSFAVYESCAREADIRFGAPEGGAP